MLKKLLNHPLTKRKMICALLGVLFGLLCVTLASTETPDIWGTPLMWSIIFNRFLIGIFIFIAGAFVCCPITKIPFRWWLRGPLLGAIVSIDIAIGIYIDSSMVDDSKKSMIFIATIVAGAFYGLIIDLVATKLAGEGKVLFESCSKDDGCCCK